MSGHHLYKTQKEECMRIALKYWLALLCLLPVFGAAADQFPAQQSFAGQALNLNGKGIRSKAFFNLYNAGLYLQASATTGCTVNLTFHILIVMVLQVNHLSFPKKILHIMIIRLYHLIYRNYPKKAYHSEQWT